ncbi:uncharacterized protein LOC132613366 [Lycium barbarum]|uniref:uncharacterized protein LOC132613366 n=1 Tax=Lycium barbarum TaxID=112863 RepID=UPI00293F7773|nr:uncharacterized protein LOC132613366 [Lycium barbarum]
MELVDMEVENDLFFAELSKRISLLIMDDDEERPSTHCSSASLQIFPQQVDPATRTPYLHGQSCKREIKGTGVFIPRSSHPRRNNRQGRSISSNTNLQRHANDPRGVLHAHYNDNPPHDSLNPRKFS